MGISCQRKPPSILKEQYLYQMTNNFSKYIYQETISEWGYKNLSLSEGNLVGKDLNGSALRGLPSGCSVSLVPVPGAH